MNCLPGQNGGAGGHRLFERPPIFGYDLDVTSLATDFTGGTVNTAWASAKKMADYTVQNEIGLVGLVLATTILQPVDSKIVGVFVVINDGADTIALHKANKMPLVHLTQQNSPSSGTPNPTNKTSSLNFGENSAMRLNSGQRVSIYATGDNVAQTFAAVLTIYTIALEKK